MYFLFLYGMILTLRLIKSDQGGSVGWIEMVVKVTLYLARYNPFVSIRSSNVLQSLGTN